MPRKYTPEERIAAFWAKVDRSGGDDACWRWIGSHIRKGYGNFGWGKRVLRSHRISFFLAYGVIPDGLFVLHKCDCTDCVNPTHLFLGTNQDNIDDMNSKGRSKHLSGADHPQCKISDEQVAEIRERYCSGGISYSELAREYSLGTSQVCRIVNRQSR